MSRCSADQKDKNVVSKLFRKHRVKHAGLVPAVTCAAEAHALRCTLTRCGVDGVDAASSVSEPWRVGGASHTRFLRPMLPREGSGTRTGPEECA